MDIEVRFTSTMVESASDLRRKTVVVIDILRATSVIVAALMAGAREVAPVAGAEDAVKVSQRLGTERTLLCGERGSVKIEGFHLGNSPLEYTPEIVGGKTLVMTTTNGTQALIKARDAERVLCGALLNAGAVARDIASHFPDELTLLCAGTHGAFSLEDALAAGAIVSELTAILPADSFRLDDASRVARMLFETTRGDLAGALGESSHGRTIAALGFDDDIKFCARLNIEGAGVPLLVGSTIRLYG